MRRLLLAPLAAAILATPIAHANPDNPADQQNFFESVESQGVSGPHDELLALGRDVCAVQHTGMDPGEIEQYLRKEAPITMYIASVIRIEAELHLC